MTVSGRTGPRFPLLLMVAVLAAACAVAGTDAAPAEGGSVAPSPRVPTNSDCPVTIPPLPVFTPPEPYPPEPTPPNAVWYGTADLWTVLEADGAYVPRKSVWWSRHFRGGVFEGQPDIAVTWRRLDIEAPPITTHSPGTNAYTAEDGWFMINGIHPDAPGCWEVTATYRQVTLSYIYRVP